jgi:hypothetical protein
LSDYTSNHGSKLIPFPSKLQRKNSDSSSAFDVETFSIKTEKIIFFCAIYMNDSGPTYCKGYIVFTDSNTLYFTKNSDSKSEVYNKCLTVAQRIARVYGGTLQRRKLNYTELKEAESI